MRSENFVIVRSGGNYNNKVGDIIINTSVETVENINRFVELVTGPEGVGLLPGDILTIHHNILRISNDIRGVEQKSMFHIDGDLYWVPLTEVFMYWRDNVWSAIDPFVFVKPIRVEDKVVGGYVISAGSESYKGKENLTGDILFSNTELKSNGINIGDRVYFTEYSQHEYNINGELCYKMKTQDILMKYT